ncbi:hypothetical protein QBC42DRAFT_333176 [Cladorrhinum samala]|uniref:DUF7907 domain-containing protein n=1 Tax=Cladorrhinum samala TaxID=585594 RepID=A0AAV9HZV3_9PEZI|nr:hypothetical protein QBC42DRAFT_333176 [Cladorrhinum samala]
MRLPTFTFLSLLGALSLAQDSSDPTEPSCAPYTKSAPFHLRLRSSDSARLNNTILISSHAGPPFRQLVTSAWYADKYGQDYVPNEVSTRFYLNSSASAGTYPCPGDNLVWEWGPGTGIADSSLLFKESRVRSGWMAYLYPGPSGESVGFDAAAGRLVLEEDGSEWSRWWICRTVWATYQYESLVWGVGEGKPEGLEGCEKVEVLREWV